MPHRAPAVDEDRYYVALGAAFVRGRAPECVGAAPAAATATSDVDAFRAGAKHGLKMHKFKRNADLPRVKRSDAPPISRPLHEEASHASPPRRWTR